MSTTPEQEAPAHIISGQRVYSDPGESVWVHQDEIYYHNFLYPDGISLTELRRLILKVDMAHDEHTGKGTITPGNLMLDAFKAMALGLAELRRQIEAELNAAPPLYPPDEEGRIWRETQTIVLENVLDDMRSLFQREG